MKEIGGYFGFEPLMSNHYYSDLIALNSGRNALTYLIQAKQIKKIYIPYYLCDSIRKVCMQNHIKYEYYHIDSNFIPKGILPIHDDEFLYIVNYYGQISNAEISNLSKRYKRLIVDNVQAFFQKPIPCVDTIYSCRKFFGVPDGAFLATDTRLLKELDRSNSKKRMNHILGRFEGKASEYYQDYQKAEETFENEPLMKMSKISYNILGAIDYEKVKLVRNENYTYLHSELASYNQLNLITPTGPYAYPFYIDKGIEIRKELATKNKIYIPTLWPEVLQNCPVNSIEYQYAANILPLPCDQRYTQEDMNRIVKMIKKYLP